VLKDPAKWAGLGGKRPGDEKLSRIVANVLDAGQWQSSIIPVKVP